MKKNIDKKSQIDSIDSNTFLNTVLPNIKVNQESYPLNDFGNDSSEEVPIKKPSSLKQT
jgi:hypothetical protein